MSDFSVRRQHGMTSNGWKRYKRRKLQQAIKRMRDWYQNYRASQARYRRRIKARASMSRGSEQEIRLINSMTNWQRTQWARHGAKNRYDRSLKTLRHFSTLQRRPA